MKHRMLIVLLLCLFTLPAHAQLADLLTSAKTIVNIRSGPGTEWRIIGNAPTGTTIRLDGQVFGGSWVRGITSTGITGWMFTDNLNLSREQAATLREIWVEEPFTLTAPGQDGSLAAPPPAATTAPSAPNASSAPPVTGGITVRGFNLGGHIAGYSEATINWMRVANMTWVKKQWRYERGQDPGVTAGWINEAHSYGFRILLGIVGNGNQINDPGYFEDYAKFVGGVAGLGVDAIEVWNEPNIDREWQAGTISPENYTELLRQSYFAIKATNANVMVISGAPAPTGFFGGCTGTGCDDNLFLARMAAAGASNYMDCVGVHYNEGIMPPTVSSGDPRGNSSHYTRYYPTMVSTYYNAFRGRKPLCFTELGYLTPEGYGPLPAGFDWAANVTLGQQAAWIDQVVNLARNSGRVRLLIVWNIDFTNYGSDPMAGFALIRPGGDCPACRALSQ